jgi:hypothetical protein
MAGRAKENLPEGNLKYRRSSAGPGVVPLDCGTHMRGAKGALQQFFFCKNGTRDLKTWITW